MRKMLLRLMMVPFLCFYAAISHAAPAPNLWTLWVYGVTSEVYNPTLPADYRNANWDIMQSPSYSSSWHQSGSWIGFWTVAGGYYSSIYASYKGSSATFLTQYPIVDQGGSVIGWSDIWYCVSCTGGGSFSTTAYGINGGSRFWSTYVP